MKSTNDMSWYVLRISNSKTPCFKPEGPVTQPFASVSRVKFHDFFFARGCPWWKMCKIGLPAVYPWYARGTDAGDCSASLSRVKRGGTAAYHGYNKAAEPGCRNHNRSRHSPVKIKLWHRRRSPRRVPRPRRRSSVRARSRGRRQQMKAAQCQWRPPRSPRQESQWRCKLSSTLLPKFRVLVARSRPVLLSVQELPV